MPEYVITRYFDWVMWLIGPAEFRQYDRMLWQLLHTEFYARNPRDDNRIKDAIDLRHKFAYDEGMDDYEAHLYFSSFPCSVLEVMAAIAWKCEETIMCDPDIGDRTYVWMTEMIDSMHLKDMTNRNYNEKYVSDRVGIMLERKYEKNGDGGLFTIHDPSINMRKEEIWFQLCLYLDEYIK